MSLSEAQNEKLRQCSRRWFLVPPQVQRHMTINHYRLDKIRFKTVHAGRRSYKTEWAKRHLVNEACRNTGLNLFFGAPTREHVKRMVWNDLKNLAGPMIQDRSETELWLKTLTGSTLYCVGFDKAERFDGTPWHGGILDEYADMKPDVLDEHVYPALMDTKGWCWFIGVPGGKNHYFDLVQKARESKNPQWADYCWLSADVMSPEEIAEAQGRMDPRTFRQELEGSFESYEGRAFVYYDSSVHRKPVVFNPLLPLDVACDFNLDPAIWEICQDHRGTICVLDEIKQRQTDIYKLCVELKRRIESKPLNKLRFFGDYQHGTARSVSAVASSWQILRGEFPHAEFCLRPNPRILDGINAVNSKLRNAKGQTSFLIDPKCLELHKDFEQCSTQDILDRAEGKDRGHASSTMRYYCNYLYPLVSAPIWRAS
jgi:hypothetical protein